MVLLLHVDLPITVKNILDMNSKEMFTRLVENAFDFLKKAFEELDQNNFKHSMINFHSALELFIKARLMAEHWTLIVANSESLNKEKFISGNFRSVSLSNGADRLENVLGKGISQDVSKAFEKVTKHRNKLVHFFHPDGSESENRTLKESIVKEQLIAWYYLHQLLNEQWKETFSDWQDQIETIDKSLRKHREFLSVVYQAKEDRIKKLTSNGIVFTKCPSCSYETLKHEIEKEKLYISECLVCNLKEKTIQVGCTDCESTVFFYGEGFSQCKQCQKNFEPDDLVEIIWDSGFATAAFMDGDYSWDLGNCYYCDGYQKIVRFDDGSYLA